MVLDFLADPRNEPNYNPLILAARKTTSGPIGLGTRYAQQVKSFGRLGDVDIEIVEYQRLGHLAFDICSAGMQVRGDLLLAAEGSGTRVVWHWRLKPRGALRILAPLVGVAGRRLERRVWIEMKHYLDARLDARVTTAQARVALSNAPEVSAGEPTRFIGLHERIAFGAYFLWPGSFGPWIWTIVLWHPEPGGDIDRSSLKNDRKVRVMTAGNIAIDEDHPILTKRLSAQDLMNLWPDEFGWPMDIGALAILDGTQLIDTDGRFKIETAREAIARRLHLVPRFRQQLYTPRRGLGGPLWVDAQHFDLAAQIGVFPVPPPAGEAQLLLAVERLRARQLDRSRPLWEIWFLPGLPQHLVGVFIRMHHTVADGMAGVALLGTLFDQQANPLTEPVPSWTPAPLPSTRELLQDAMRSRLRAAERLLRALGHPLDTTRRVQRAWPSARVGITDSRAPQTSLNRRIGVHRTITIIRCRLDLAKQIAHAHEAKVNDVLLAAVAGGLRQLLGGRGEPVDGVVLRAFVPVSLHHEQGGQARGNQDATMIIATDWRARPGSQAPAHRHHDRRAEEANPLSGNQRLPEWRSPAHGMADGRAPTLHEPLRNERARPAASAVPCWGGTA